jgi:hypothetical protein
MHATSHLLKRQESTRPAFFRAYDNCSGPREWRVNAAAKVSVGRPDVRGKCCVGCPTRPQCANMFAYSTSLFAGCCHTVTKSVGRRQSLAYSCLGLGYSPRGTESGTGCGLGKVPPIYRGTACGISLRGNRAHRDAPISPAGPDARCLAWTGGGREEVPFEQEWKRVSGYTGRGADDGTKN